MTTEGGPSLKTGRLFASLGAIAVLALLAPAATSAAATPTALDGCLSADPSACLGLGLPANDQPRDHAEVSEEIEIGDEEVNASALPGASLRTSERSPPEPTLPGYEGLEHVADVGSFQDGAGVRWTDDGSYGLFTDIADDELRIVDLSDPTSPETVAEVSMPGDATARDVETLDLPGGPTIAAVASGDHVTFVDIADPTKPTVTSQYQIDAHNVATLPGTSLVFPSGASGEGESNPILDASNRSQPTVVGRFGDHSCHDIEFASTPDGDRLYCAGVGETQIWSIDDPRSPELVTRITNPFISAPGALGPVTNPFISAPAAIGPGFHHWAVPAHDGDLLIVGDEAVSSFAPTCAPESPADPGRDLTTGALWFYDVTDEDEPRLYGWFSPETLHEDQLQRSELIRKLPRCTSHFGEVLEGRSQLVVGWYDAGTLLVDFSDPRHPYVVDRFDDDTTTWDARVHGTTVITGDLQRGGDVLRLLP